ncbi:hypothetical protein LO762_25205 [Actinocorallia sp. API 0066]|uniref:hypothetical protein n=1 Tax=Actinocorallia sp. API 0066 TaxID=2896846 RepID=UPI001E391148|nr:hypothetical protein [Actinocorallia sp. API 0066]MCD0452459.1 hypothetical protein [Actinocorallia sp. API 0066]
MTLALAADGPLHGLLDRPPFDRALWNDPEEPGLRTGVLPPGVDEPGILGEMVATVCAAMAAEPLPPLVLALHEGLAALTEGRFDGPALRTVRTLGGARFESPYSVVISQRLFEDLSALERPVLPVARFRPLQVRGIGAVSAHPLEWTVP